MLTLVLRSGDRRSHSRSIFVVEPRHSEEHSAVLASSPTLLSSGVGSSGAYATSIYEQLTTEAFLFDLVARIHNLRELF
jgi:hypothetical protein